MHSPLTSVSPVLQVHLPADNVNEGLQVVQDPDMVAHVVQFPAHVLQTPDE